MLRKSLTNRVRAALNALGGRCAIALLGLAVIFSTAAEERRLQPFTSDGCSSFPDGPVFPEAGKKDLWHDCCVVHDRAYWRGGSYQERLAADQSLERCVEALGEVATARMMLLGVRVGGSPFWPTSFRWGYGWPYLRGYGALTQAELAQVQERLELERTATTPGVELHDQNGRDVENWQDRRVEQERR